MRQPLWKKAAKRHLIPRLHGAWIITPSGVLVRKPLDLFACFLLREHSAYGGYRLHVAVDALYEPFGEGWSISMGERLGHNRVWRNFVDEDDAEPEMALIADLVNTVGTALFDEQATLDGFRRKCGSYNRGNSPDGIGNPPTLRREALTEILLGQYEAAVDSFELILRSAEKYQEGRHWPVMLADEAREYLAGLASDPDGVRNAVLAGVATRKAELKLPDE